MKALSIVTGLIIFASVTPTLAQTWDGGGMNDNWTTAFNWNPDVIPANNFTANVVFGASGRLTPIVNVTQQIQSLTFNNSAGAYVIGGPSSLIISSGGITNNDADLQTLNVTMPVGSSQTWNAAAGPIAILGAVQISPGDILTLTGSSAITLSDLGGSGTGAVVKNGSGVLQIAGSMNHTGGTTINSGVVRFTANSALPSSGAFTLLNSTMLDINGFTGTIGQLTSASATTSVNLPGTSVLTVTGTASFAGTVNGSPTATFIKGGNNSSWTYSGTGITAGVVRVTGTNTNLVLSGAERLADTCDLEIAGGSLQLGGQETVDGFILQSGSILGNTSTLIATAFNVEQGSIGVHLAGPGALTKTTIGSTVTLNNSCSHTGGTLINQGTLALGANECLPDAGPLTIAQNNANFVVADLVEETIGALSGVGDISMGASTKLTLGTGGASSTYSGEITGDGELVKTGSGTLSLAGVNAYTGKTTIADGTLRLLGHNRLPNGEIVQVDAGATLDLNNFNETVGPLVGFGNISLGVATLTADHTVPGIPFSGVISGTGGLTKNGTGTQALAASNSYTGVTTINGGILEITASERLADSSDILVNGGTFHLNAFTETVEEATLTSGVVTGAGTLSASYFRLQSGNVHAALGGNGDVLKETSGIVKLFGPNGYSGETRVVGGELQLSASDVIPNASPVIVIAPATLRQFTSGISESIRNIVGDGVVRLNDSTLRIGVGGEDMGFTGQFVGTGNIIKIGAGALALSGASTFTGTLSIDAGSVDLALQNERLANSSDLNVNGGAFQLAGFTETLDTVTLTSGSIAGPGTLNATNLQLISGAFGAEFTGPGPLTKSGAGVVTLTSVNSHASGTVLLGGVLEVAADSALGAAGGSVTLNGGTLRLIQSFDSNRPLILTASGGAIEPLGATHWTGVISGAGTVTKTGMGTLVLSQVSPSFGGLTAEAGDLVVENGANLGVTGVSNVSPNGFLTVDSAVVSSESFANSGELLLINDGRLVGPTSNSGTLTGDGRITGAVTNNVLGDILVEDGDTLFFNGASANSNAGYIEIDDAELRSSGLVTNLASTGLIFGTDALLRFDGGLTNAGSVAFSGGFNLLTGDITNQAGASIVASGLTEVTYLDDVANSGQIRTSTGSNSTFFGAVTGAGTFPGAGIVFFEGDLRPGASPAVVSFGGDVSIGGQAMIEIEIGGTTAGNGHDRLAIAGNAYLDGALTVTLIDGYETSGGETFDVLTANLVQGTFAVIDLPPEFTIEYLSDRVRLHVASDVCMGDLNGDTLINGHDIGPFVACVTSATTCAGSDADQDGLNANVDLAGDLPAFVSQLLAGINCP